VVAVIEEVKSREDGYDTVKKLLAHIDDLPASSQICKRERRLILHGYLIHQSAAPEKHITNTSLNQHLVRTGCVTTYNEPLSIGKVHALVFSDLLLVAIESQGTTQRLVPKWGLSRILGVTELAEDEGF
jgi:hypothetical protein